MRTARWPERGGPEGVSSLALSQAEFNRLVADHGAALYRMAYRMTGDRHEAEDMVQDTYRSAWKSRGRFQSGRSERAWLVAILRRRVADRWRRREPLVLVSAPGQLEPGQPGDDPLKNQYTDEIQHALDRLSSELREALLLVVVAELTHQEAADLLGVPLGTVLSRVSRARKRLRKYLLAAGSRQGTS
jgi:RNA polymerase sigma-70 factor (ECF subfamily)